MSICCEPRVIGNVGAPTSMAVPLPIPNQNGLLGVALFGQSLWLDPQANVFGALTSNGLELVLGDL